MLGGAGSCSLHNTALPKLPCNLSCPECVRFAQAEHANPADQQQQQPQQQPALQAGRQASEEQHAHPGAECAGPCGAAGQAQQQQQDAQAALQSYERAAALGRQALHSAAGPAPSSRSPERGAEGQAAQAPAEAAGGVSRRAGGGRGVLAAADGAHTQKPGPDPDPGDDPGRKPRPAGHAPALQVAARALLAQAALLRALGLRVAAEAAEDEALALDPFAQNGTFELRRVRAAGQAGAKPSRGAKAPTAAAGA